MIEAMKKSTSKIGEIPVPALLLVEAAKAFAAQTGATARERMYKEIGQSISLGVVYQADLASSLYLPLQREFKNLFVLAESCREFLSRFYGDGYISAALVANLPAGKEISAHSDPGWGFSFTHRVHWILKTNEEVRFDVDGSSIHMKSGELWEVDNKLRHSVRNDGATDRWHFIFDYHRADDVAHFYCRDFDKGSFEDIVTRLWLRRSRA